MDSSKIKAIFIAALVVLAALYLGLTAATAQIETILWVVGVMTLIVCLMLGRSIWLLIPFMTAVNISFQIPGQPNTLLIAQALVIGFSTLMFLMRRLPFQLRFTELEFWCLVLSLLILQVYMRNPVGLSLFSGSTVGGKGYFLYGIAFATAVLLCGLKVSTKDLKWVLPLSILGGLSNLAISILGTISPTIGYYSGTSDMKSFNQGYDNQVIDESAATRIGFLGGFGHNLSLWISSYISPLRACFRPLWAILLFIAILAAGMSGFRNSIAAVGATLLLGIAYRSGRGGLLVSILGGIMGVALLAVINSMFPLPPNIQRSLTILPGTWEERYKEDSKGSTEWRMEIWKEVLTSPRWIQNKLMGDGLGFTAVELAAQLNARDNARLGISGFDAHRETILSNGDYHSGPVSTIRVIGYVGLFFFLLAQIRLAVHAHRQILRCRDTEWYPLALFIGLPMIMGPFFFTFVFGDFKSAAGGFLLLLGMMRLIENNLPLPAYEKAVRYIPRPLAHNVSQARKP